ncbi:hypothetical protein NFI96_012642, partial [Prochilodus magdalenae]
NRGPTGDPGVRGPPGRCKSGFLLVMHSQTTSVPSCPSGMSTLWEGYSLLYLEGQEKAHTQDLGQPGSCVRVFSTMPFLYCNQGSCQYASRNDKSYWLSTTEAIPKAPVSGYQIQRHISRCVVCETPSPAISIHSQRSSPPRCPRDWEVLWSGFSFLVHTGTGDEGGGQSLTSSGSCLKQFFTHPFVECQGSQGTCHFFPDIFSFWLTHVSDQGFNSTSKDVVLTDPTEQRNRASHCSVCMKSAN